MRVLLSGFEPFGGADRNPSAEIVAAIAAEPPTGLDLATIVLPVETELAAERLLEAWRTSGADAVVMLGEAAGRQAVTPEAVAINLRDFPIADNAGRTVEDRPVVEEGPDAYFATLPIRAMVESIRAAGVPAARSLSAGSYLCNEVSYRMLHEIAGSGRSAIAGFVHVPRMSEQLAGDANPGPSLPLGSLVTATRAALEALSSHDAG